MNNKVSEYISDIVHFKLNHDGESILKLQEDSKNIMVDLYDVGEALLEVTNDIIKHNDIQQATMEARLRAIVSKLPEDIQWEINKEFKENEDDMFL
ncbi:hypothetical protein vBBceHLY2_00011 [Bacillus phage vB_BceH_LY2]|nr:hypothetical protein vBBceHLY2_00011 [Bacillus phage vB_BceH_LY2]